VKELVPEISRIASSPTKTEISEEVSMVAKEFIESLRVNA
jgi:hypothetical protein